MYKRQAEYRDVEFVRDKSYDSVTFDTINKLAYKEMCNYRDSLVRAFYNGALGGKYEDIAGFVVGDVTKFFPDNMNVYDPILKLAKSSLSLLIRLKLRKIIQRAMRTWLFSAQVGLIM